MPMRKARDLTETVQVTRRGQLGCKGGVKCLNKAGSLRADYSDVYDKAVRTMVQDE